MKTRQEQIEEIETIIKSNITDKQECVKNRYGEKCYIKRYFLESGN